LLVDDARASRTWARVAGDLGTAVRAAGGRKRVACRNPVVNHAAQTELAWILHLPLAEVRTRAEDAGVVFVTEDRVANVPPAVTVDLPLRTMAGTDEWTVYALGTATPFGPCFPSR
jgi:hypothetical protein